MEDSDRRVWQHNLTLRTQISAFLGGTFFAAMLLFVSQERMVSAILSGDRLVIFTVGILCVTFVAFVFSAFAFGLSSDFFVVSILATENRQDREEQAKKAADIGGEFFKVAYTAMMFSLFGILAQIHPVLGFFGGVIFVIAWAYLYMKTRPYEIKKKESKANVQLEK